MTDRIEARIDEIIAACDGEKMKVLESSDDRFEAFPDPLNNWIVWDRDQDDFAEVRTQVLSSLTQSQARAFCSLLNILFSKSNQSA